MLGGRVSASWTADCRVIRWTRRLIPLDCVTKRVKSTTGICGGPGLNRQPSWPCSPLSGYASIFLLSLGGLTIFNFSPL